MTSGSQGALVWRRASSCEGGACVEIAIPGHVVFVRSSKDSDGTHVTLSRDEWKQFVAAIKDGAFDGL